MDENIKELLAKAEDALFQGDQRTAGLLVHKVLTQDFTNHQAWQLLHSMRGGEQPLVEFQQAFAQKYYPQSAHLLTSAIPEIPPTPEPVTPPYEPVPAIEPKPSVSEPEPESLIPEAPPPEPHSPSSTRYCPSCGASLTQTAKFCNYCGYTLSTEPPAVPAAFIPSEPEPVPPVPEPIVPASPPLPPAPEPLYPALTPLPPAPEPYIPSYPPPPPVPEPVIPAGQPPVLAHEHLSSVSEIVAPTSLSPAQSASSPSPFSPESTLHLTRLKTYVGSMVKFKVLIDGVETDTLSNGEMKSYTLPAGEHTFAVKLRKNSSVPLMLRLNPGETLQLACQPPKYTLKAIGPDLEVVLPGSPLPKPRGIFAWLWPIGCIVFIIFSCFGTIAGYVAASYFLNQ